MSFGRKFNHYSSQCMSKTQLSGIFLVTQTRSESYRAKNLWWLKTKIRIEKFLSNCPPLLACVQSLWRTGRWLAIRSRMRLVALLKRRVIGLDIDRTLSISPDRIVYCSLYEFGIHDFKGAVMSGNWDRLEKRFEYLDVYNSLKQVFTEGKEWTETLYYQHLLDAVKKGEFLFGCSDENDIKQKCRNIEAIFRSIRDKGYKTRRDLVQLHIADPLAFYDEISISIGRYGDLLFSDGAHRLAIAKILGIKQIPVKISVRHTEWVTFAVDLLEYAKELGGKLHQPVTHPDLADIPAHHDCEDRFLMIRDNMSAKRGSLLDIGANLGYYCHKFEDEGFQCYAVEDSKAELYFMQKLRRAENRKFTIVGSNMLDWSEVGDLHFDVVLALNILHHYLKTKEAYDKLVALLRNLKMTELFFEPHVFSEPQMKGAYRNYTPDDFVNFITANSLLKRAEIIGEARDGRKIYKLS